MWDLDKAQALALDALELANALADPAAQCRVYWILLLINRFGKEGAARAVEYGERSLALARELGLPEQLAYTLKDLGVAYSITGRFFDAKAVTREASDLWRKLDNNPMLAEILSGQAAQGVTAGELDEAVRAGEESLALNRRIGNRFGLSIAAGFMSMAHQELGNTAAAIQLASEAISCAREIDLRSGLVSFAYLNLADTYTVMGDFGQAVEYVETAISRTELPALANQSLLKSTLASIYLRQGKRAQAAALLQPYRDWSFADTLRATAAISARPLYAQAELALAQGDPQRALALMDDVIAAAGGMGMLILLPTALHLRAQALWALGRRDDARVALLDARARANAMQARTRLLPILMTLGEFEAAAGQAAAAEAARSAAREVVAYIASHAPEELRAPFLALPGVRDLGAF